MSSGRQQPVEDQVWSVELHGIEPIKPESRHGTPFEVFWVWFGGNINIVSISFGAILASDRLNLWQSLLVGLVAIPVSFALVGVLSVVGVWGGAPMLTLSRAVFGTRGNTGPGLVSWINLVGWETIMVITSAYAFLAILKSFGLPANSFWTVVSLIAMALLVVACGNSSWLRASCLMFCFRGSPSWGDSYQSAFDDAILPLNASWYQSEAPPNWVLGLFFCHMEC